MEDHHHQQQQQQRIDAPLLGTANESGSGSEPAPLPRLFLVLDGMLSSRLGKAVLFVGPLVALSVLACSNAEEAILIALGCNVFLVCADAYRSRYKAEVVFPDVIMLTICLVQAGLAVCIYADGDTIRPFMGVAIVSSLAFVALGSIVIGRPFTIQFAEKAVTPAVRAHPNFVSFNKAISFYWACIFLLMDLCIVLSIVLFDAGDCDSNNQASAPAILLGTVAPVALPVLGGYLTPHVVAIIKAKYKNSGALEGGV